MSGQINQIHTPCKNCVFAEYETKQTEHGEVESQVGCYAGMLDKFREDEDIEILEVFDNEKEFFVINDVRCHGARSEKWKDKNFIQGFDLVEIMKAEWKLPYHAIVINLEEHDVIKTLNSLIKQRVRPKALTVIQPRQKPTQARAVIDFLREINIPWYMKNAKVVETDDQYIKQVMANDKHKLPYFAVFYSGCVVPRDTFKVISDLVFVDMVNFTYIEPNNSGSGKIVPMGIYNKANAYALRVEDIEKPTTLKITDLCPNFPK